MTKLVLKDLPCQVGDTLYTVLMWQRLNAGVLALCPERWADLTDNQKWALLRILSRRGGYKPDWLDLPVWRSLCTQMLPVSFDTDTELISMQTSEKEEQCMADEAAYLASMSGKAPQSFREVSE